MKRRKSSSSLYFKGIALVVAIVSFALGAVAVPSISKMRETLHSERSRAADALASGLSAAAESVLAADPSGTTEDRTLELEALVTAVGRADGVAFAAISIDATGPEASFVRDADAWKAWLGGDPGQLFVHRAKIHLETDGLASE